MVGEMASRVNGESMIFQSPKTPSAGTAWWKMARNAIADGRRTATTLVAIPNGSITPFTSYLVVLPMVQCAAPVK